MSRNQFEKTPTRSKRWLILLQLCLVLGLFFLFAHFFQDCASVHALLDRAGWAAPLVYFLLSTIAMSVLIPRTLFVILGGVCFGLYWGTILVTLSSMAAAIIGFLISRYAAREKFERAFRKRKWFYQFEQAALESGLSFVIITRAIHVIHFGASNYAFGLLPISFKHFIVGTFLGLMPGSIALVYGGNVFGCTLLNRDFDLPSEIKERLILATVLMTLSSLLPLIWHFRKNKKHHGKKA